MAREAKGRWFVRAGSAKDEVVVTADQDAYHRGR